MSEEKVVKPKGYQWPGMVEFDSATPEMKRMRNQRKDGSVLQRMIASSQAITTDEVVYNLDGTHNHTRDIFGPLSCEGSPVRPVIALILKFRVTDSI